MHMQILHGGVAEVTMHKHSAAGSWESNQCWTTFYKASDGDVDITLQILNNVNTPVTAISNATHRFGVVFLGDVSEAP